MSDLDSLASSLPTRNRDPLADYLNRINTIIQDLKGNAHDVRKCCRHMTKVLSECREAVQYTSHQDDIPSIFQLGVLAMQIAGSSLQIAFSHSKPPVLEQLRLVTPGPARRSSTLVRTFKLQDSDSLRTSVLGYILDQLHAHQALKEDMEVVMDPKDPESDDARYERHRFEDFFELATAAFRLCLGDAAMFDKGFCHSEYGIILAVSQNMNRPDWRSFMFEVATVALLALAQCHSSWFFNQEVRLWEQICTGPGPSPKAERKEGEGTKVHFSDDLTLVLSDEQKKAIFSDEQNDLLQNQRSLFDKMLRSSPQDVSEYLGKLNEAIKMIGLSVDMYKNTHGSGPERYNEELFKYAKQGFRILELTIQKRFGNDAAPIPLETYNPDREIFDCPRTDTESRRSWAITRDLNAMFLHKAGDPNRLRLAKSALELSLGGAADMPTKDFELPEVWKLGDDQGSVDWRRYMLKFASYALVGLAQYVLEYFRGKDLVIWGESVPKTMEQTRARCIVDRAWAVNWQYVNQAHSEEISGCR